MSSITKEVEISINVEEIGKFVGEKGKFIIKRLIVPTKKEYLDEMKDDKEKMDEAWKSCKIYCGVSSEEEKVKIKLQAPTEDCMTILEKNVTKYVEFLNNPNKPNKPNKPNNPNKPNKPNKPKENVNEKRRYIYNLGISSHYIGKLIGMEGSNISELCDTIQSVIKLEKRPYIKFYDQGPESAKRLVFNNINSGNCFINVNYFGVKSYKQIEGEICKYVNKILNDSEVAPDSVSDTESKAVSGEESDGEW
tara:strand:+ start:500 stop:1249 length:750 start_codon:yes stop_codon:yes gene_type:complete